MSKYTTGEMAKLCNVSVRTVQFYDAKGVMHPSDLTEGGRRLYTDDDLTKLRLICTLKAIGLSLDSIKGIMASESPGKILSLLLDEQMKQLGNEIKERQSQLEAIKVIKESIRDKATIPANSIIDIEHMMENKKGLRKVRGIMLVIGAFMSAGLITTIILWVLRGMWMPFVIWIPHHALLTLPLLKFYHGNTAYICPECNKTFRSTLREMTFASHTPKTRYLTCTGCGHKGYCIEVYAKSEAA